MTTTILKATAQQFVGEFVRGYDRIAPAETIRLENGVLCGESGAELKIADDGQLSIHYASDNESKHFTGIVTKMEQDNVKRILWRCVETGRMSEWVRK